RRAHVTQYEPPAARTSRAPAPAPRSGPLTLSPAHARPRSGQRAHRIPGRKHQRLALQRGTQLLGQMLDVDQHLEHVLIEPGVGHGEVPRLTHLVTPTVLHPPTARGAVVHIHTGEQHGVRHGRLLIPDPVLLTEGEFHVVHPGVVIQAGIPHAVVALHVRPDVAAEPHRLPRHDGLHRRTFSGLDIHVQVPHRVAAHYVAQVFHGEHG